ncbi:MAG: FAD-binding oxidoreductase [Syntrophaceae bacterium]|nr:FAD-binding oxidoreductase [Syntrophaceae bacterium]
MDIPKTADAVIIGGGVMGASTAYHLALKGCKKVVLLERDPLFGQEATGKCAGGIRYQFATEINIRLSLLSLPMLDRYEEELGQAIDLRRCGYLFLLTREEDVRAFRASLALQHRLGVMTEWLKGEEVRSRLPLMEIEDVLGATWNPQDGLVDPNSIVQGYIVGAKRLEAKCLTDVEVIGITLKKGSIHGVQTRQGEIETPIVVNAAGPWAAQIGNMIGVDIPVVPIRRQIAVTTPISQLPPHFPFVIDFAKNLYFHREGPSILTGMSNLNEPPSFNQEVDRDWEFEHFDAAMERMPLLENVGISSRWAGLYEVTPDAHPILGKVPEVDGFYCINGFSGHGLMHGPICGLLLAEEIIDGKAHTLDITALRLSRFREGKLIQEYNVV